MFTTLTGFFPQLRDSRDFQHLKSALFAGGITPDTLAVLISGTAQAEAQKHCTSAFNAWADEFDDQPPTYLHPAGPPLHHQQSYSSMQWKSGASAPFNLAPGGGTYHKEACATAPPPTQRTFNNVPGSQRYVSCGEPPSSIMGDTCLDPADSLMDEGHDVEEIIVKPGQPLRTLYFTGFHARTTYRDLLSVIKGGKLLGISMRSEKSATVTFLDGAAEYLAWVKRNDIYLHGKRIEVRWAERQYNLNGHIQNKIDGGATRNILIRNAVEKGFTEARIREDMDHIHNLVVIDVEFRDGNAYVYTNSVHNALFAKTCMMSRTTYRGCKISFFGDECNVPLPARVVSAKFISPEPSRKVTPLSNRFDLLVVDGTNSISGSSNEENQTPKRPASVYDDEYDDEAIGFTTRHGVSLQFLDDDSNI